MARVCVFDVNETLLDLAALDPLFAQAFGDATIRKTWFAQFLKAAFVGTIIESYTDFGTVGGTALDMTASIVGKPLTDADRQAILGKVRTLPPHSDVVPAFAQLQHAGMRMAALTNSTEDVARAQLTNAGLAPYMEQILSADMVQRLKPAREPYHLAAERLGVPIDQIRLIACHDWDVAGAMQAGAAAAFVARPGMVLNPLFGTPDVVGGTMTEVAAQIIAIEAS
jgi:2-haloacid dehalogenase